MASPDGSSVFVAGSSAGATSGDDYATISYDAVTGATRWHRRHSGPLNGIDRVEGIVVSPDGAKVVVTGTSAGATTGDDYATIAYDAATGATLWYRRYAATLPYSLDQAHDIAVSADGTKVFVTGHSRSGYATIAYNSDSGAVVWFRRYLVPVHGSTAYAVAASPDGTKVFVTGRGGGTTNVNLADDMVTIAYDALTGATLWNDRYADPVDPTRDERGYNIAPSPDGSTIVVSGSAQDPQSAQRLHDFLTVAIDAATGSRRWVARESSAPDAVDDVAAALAVSYDGSQVYVTGRSFPYGLTYAYDMQSGSVLWSHRYDRLDIPSRFADVAASTDGTQVFVTGSSGRFNTIAYSTI